MTNYKVFLKGVGGNTEEEKRVFLQKLADAYKKTPDEMRELITRKKRVIYELSDQQAAEKAKAFLERLGATAEIQANNDHLINISEIPPSDNKFKEENREIVIDDNSENVVEDIRDVLVQTSISEKTEAKAKQTAENGSEINLLPAKERTITGSKDVDKIAMRENKIEDHLKTIIKVIEKFTVINNDDYNKETDPSGCLSGAIGCGSFLLLFILGSFFISSTYSRQTAETWGGYWLIISFVIAIIIYAYYIIHGSNKDYRNASRARADARMENRKELLRKIDQFTRWYPEYFNSKFSGKEELLFNKTVIERVLGLFSIGSCDICGKILQDGLVCPSCRTLFCLNCASEQKGGSDYYSKVVPVLGKVNVLDLTRDRFKNKCPKCNTALFRIVPSTDSASPPRGWLLNQYVDEISGMVKNPAPGESSGLYERESTIQSLGKDIDNEYGFDGMQYVFMAINYKVGIGPMSELKRIWDGIGEWRH